MGLRGPASTVLQKLDAQRRREVDAALIDAPTVDAVYRDFKLAEAGISASAFYRYAKLIRWEARLRYIGELVRQAAGAKEHDEQALAKAGRLLAHQRLAEVLDDESLGPAKVAAIAGAISQLTKARVSEDAEARQRHAEKVADEVTEKLGDKTDAETLAWIREHVAGLG